MSTEKDMVIFNSQQDERSLQNGAVSVDTRRYRRILAFCRCLAIAKSYSVAVIQIVIR